MIFLAQFFNFLCMLYFFIWYVMFYFCLGVINIMLFFFKILLYHWFFFLKFFYIIGFFFSIEEIKIIFNLFLNNLGRYAFYYYFDLWVFNLFFDYFYLLKDYYFEYYEDIYMSSETIQYLINYFEELELSADISQIIVFDRLIIEHRAFKFLFLFWYNLYKGLFMIYLIFLEFIIIFF